MCTEPGLPGDLDDDGRPYFFPSNQKRPADSREQRDGFIPRWEYRGHTDSIKDVCATGEDSFGRVRFVSTDGKNAASWLELGDGDSVRIATCEHVINAMTYVPPLNVVAAASVSVDTHDATAVPPVLYLSTRHTWSVSNQFIILHSLSYSSWFD